MGIANQIGRRGFLARLGIGVAAAPAMARESVMALEGSINGWTPPAFPGTESGAIPMPSPDSGDPIKRALRDQLSVLRRKNAVSLAYRIDGLDIDIHALRSLPPATRVRMQRRRDDELRSSALNILGRLDWL